ncbi:hypothetical protein BJY17_000659 [Agromyces hippuratus]|uniref:Uncharacterized protein n=1 Tax=Agromyces hippuratus TaxID=286438 RepID=A0A852WP34_9MICO|nr:hypothetical protein [Agromyces hippuratus]
MGGLGVVELQRPGQGFEHGVGCPGEAAALETRVVVDAHTGEHRHLFTAQSRNPAIAAVGR